MKILQDHYADGFFDVSAAHGFLPQSLPLDALPAPYTPLQSLLDAMPVVKEDGTNATSTTPVKFMRQWRSCRISSNK